MAKRARMPDGSIICSICSMPVRDDSMICPLCGAPLEGQFDGVACEACETVVSRALPRCSLCGTELPRFDVPSPSAPRPEVTPVPPTPESTAPGISFDVRVEQGGEPSAGVARDRKPGPSSPISAGAVDSPGSHTPATAIPFAADIAGRLEEGQELIEELAAAVDGHEWARLPEIAEMLAVTLDSLGDLVALSRQAREVEPGVTTEALKRWVENIDRCASLVRQEIAELGLAWVRIGERESLLEPRDRALQAVESSPDPPEASKSARCGELLAKLRGFHDSRSETEARASLGALRKGLRALDAAAAGKSPPGSASQPLSPAAKLDAAIWESESTRLLAEADALLAKMGAPMTLADAEAAAGPVPLSPPSKLPSAAVSEELADAGTQWVGAGQDTPADSEDEPLPPPPPPWEPHPRAPAAPAPRRRHVPATAAPGWPPRIYPVNGLVPRGQRRAATRSPRRTSRVGAAAFGAVVLVVFAFLSFWPQPAGRDLIVVDGDASDWSAVAAYADVSGDGGSANADEFRATSGGGRFYALARPTDSGFGALRTGSFYILIDGDGLASTGLAHRGLGCELMAKVVVDVGAVATATAYRFEESDRSNWSGWVAIGAVSAAFVPGLVEVGLDADPTSTAWRASFALQDSTGATDLSDFVMAGDAPSLRARLVPGAEVLKGATPVAARLILESSGGTVTVDSVRLGGSPVDGAPVSVQIPPGGPRSFDLTLRPGVISPGSAAEVRLLGVSAGAAVAIDHGADRVSSYYEVAPAKVRIDGAFADWNNASLTPDPADPLPPRLDIRETRSTNSTEAGGPAFLVSAAGVAMLGDILPSKTIKPAPGPGGGPIVLPRIDGSDSLLLYLDIGPSPSTGFPIAGIGADYLMYVKGDGGTVKQSTIASWAGNKWGAPAAAAANSTGARVEVGAPKTAIDWSAGPGLEWHAVLRGWDGQNDAAVGPAVLDPIIILANGSAYRSTGGVFAYRGTAPAASGQSYADLAISGSAVYALRTDGAVYESVDQGASWGGGPFIDALPATSDFFNIETDGSGSLYGMRNGAEFYRCIATCGGAWGSMFSDGMTGSHVAVDLVRTSGSGTGASFYALRNMTNIFIRNSTAGGASWTTLPQFITGGTATQVAIGVYGNAIYVLDRDGTIRVSTDLSVTWSNLADQPPSCAGCYKDLSVDPSDGRIFISQHDGSTHYWDQGGGTWVSLPSPSLSGLTGVVYVPETAATALVAGAALMVTALILTASPVRRSLRAPPPRPQPLDLLGRARLLRDLGR